MHLSRGAGCPLLLLLPLGHRGLLVCLLLVSRMSAQGQASPHLFLRGLRLASRASFRSFFFACRLCSRAWISASLLTSLDGMIEVGWKASSPARSLLYGLHRHVHGPHV